jgi:hypothetical protein
MKIEETAVLKLVTGEEVMSEVNEGENFFELINPVGVAIVRGPQGQPSVGFAPFPLHAEQKTGNKIVIAKDKVVYHYLPSEDFFENYNKIFGSGIILPPKDLIKG